MDLNITQDGAIELGKSTVATVAAVGALKDAKLKLHTGNHDFDGTEDKAVLDADEADYNTYAPATMTWSVASLADTGQIEFIGTAAEFRPTDALAPNTVTGFTIVNSGDTKCLFQGKLDGEGADMNDTLDSILLIPRYRPAGDSIAEMVS